MSGKGSRGGKGRGRGRPKKVESEEDRIAREQKEEVERKKYKLIDYVRQYPVLYDLADPEHLNTAVTRVLWEEIAEKLGESGKNNMQNLHLLSVLYQHNITLLTGINNMQNSFHSLHGKRDMVAELEGPIQDTAEEGKKWFRGRPTCQEITMAVLSGDVVHETIYLFMQVLQEVVCSINNMQKCQYIGIIQACR